MKLPPKDREAEFTDKVAAVKAHFNKLERRLKNGRINVGDIEIQINDFMSQHKKPSKKKKEKTAIGHFS